MPTARHPPARLTLVFPVDPPTAGKKFTLGTDGMVKSETVGWYRTAIGDVVEATSPADLGRMIQSASEIGGYCVHAVPRDVSNTQPTLDATGKTEGSIARTLEHFERPEGRGFMAIDVDEPFDPAPEAMRGALIDAAPLFAEAEFLWLPSASSLIYRGDTLIRPLKGAHGYIGVEDATDLDRATDVLFGRLVLAGHCALKFSGTGGADMRTVFDKAMRNPVQPDYISPPFCGPGLEQRRGEPRVLNHGGVPFVDTRKALPDLTRAERAEVRRTEAKMRMEQEPALREHRASVKARKRDEAVLSDRPDLADDPDGLAREVSARETAGGFDGIDAMLAGKRTELPLSWTIALRDGRRMTGAEILDAGMDLHNEICRDPRNESYMSGRIHLDGPTPHVWCCSSGGAVLSIGTDAEREERVEAGRAWARLRLSMHALPERERTLLLEYIGLGVGPPPGDGFTKFRELWDATSEDVRAAFEDAACQTCAGDQGDDR